MTNVGVKRDHHEYGSGYQRAPIHEAANTAPARKARPSRAMDKLIRYWFSVWLPRWEKYRALPRNMFYSRLLRTEGIRLGSDSRIRGINSLHIGHSFRALDHLWLEAVERDRVGNCYNPSLIIGNNVDVGNSVHLAATTFVCIGDEVLIGSRVTITDHNHGLYKGESQSSPLERPANRLLNSTAETIVESNVWIGDGVVILPGSHIGKGTIIGANSVVNGNIPDYCIAAGIPARPIRLYDCESRSWLLKDGEAAKESGVRH
jgi:acetyltransferase-like isoleucine patch superfamily enzyme